MQGELNKQLDKLDDKIIEQAEYIDKLQQQIKELKKENERLSKCPRCGDLIIYPRGDTPYCEECGWPDEVFDKPELVHIQVRKKYDYALEIEVQNAKLQEEISKYAQAIEYMKNALERLARLGNGDQYGNSEGNTIAQAALNKWQSDGLTRKERMV